MLRAPLLLALAPGPACGARDGDGAGAHAAYCRPDRRHASQSAGEQAHPDAEFGIPVTGVARSRFHTATHARADPPAAMTARQPDQPGRHAECGRRVRAARP
jgi:hypothetical protein